MRADFGAAVLFMKCVLIIIRIHICRHINNFTGQTGTVATCNGAQARPELMHIGTRAEGVVLFNAPIHRERQPSAGKTG